MASESLRGWGRVVCDLVRLVTDGVVTEVIGTGRLDSSV